MWGGGAGYLEIGDKCTVSRHSNLYQHPVVAQTQCRLCIPGFPELKMAAFFLYLIG